MTIYKIFIYLKSPKSWPKHINHYRRIHGWQKFGKYVALKRDIKEKPLCLELKHLRTHEKNEYNNIYSHSAWGGLHDLVYGKTPGWWEKQLATALNLAKIEKIFALIHLDCMVAKTIIHERNLVYSVEQEKNLCLDTTKLALDFFTRRAPKIPVTIYLQDISVHHEIFVLGGQQFVPFHH